MPKSIKNTDSWVFYRSLKAYDKKVVARKMGCTVVHFRNIMNGSVDCTPEFAERLEIVTKKGIKKKDLRPDIRWGFFK